MTLIVVTGGVRSGKSSFAEELARKKGGKVLYQATGVACDTEMEDRIQQHRERRPTAWGLLESPLDLTVAPYAGYDVILVDCLSTWVSNQVLQAEEQGESSELGTLHHLRTWIENVAKLNHTVVVVTSEVGLGGVAMSSLGRVFQDLLGEANQLIARQADEVYAVFSGIPWRLK